MSVDESGFVASQMFARRPTADVFSFAEWLGQLAQESGVDLSNVESFVEANKRRLWNGVLRYIDKYNHSIGFEYHRVFDQERMLIEDRQYVLRRKAKNGADIRLSYRWLIVDYFSKLSPRDYEFVGAMVSVILGARHATVTRGGGDGGIDFFAVVPMHGDPSLCEHGHNYIKVIGQSKKYTSRLQAEQVRSFSDVIDDIRRGSVSTSAHLPEWFSKFHAPIVGWINAHSGFQSGAIALASHRGIIVSDTPSLAQRVVKSRRLPAIPDENVLRGFLDSQITQLTIPP